MFVKKAWKNMSAFLRQPLLQSKELYSLNKKLRTEIKDRQRTEEAFRSLAEATSFQFGSAFFDSMVVQLSKTLGADCTLIGEVQGNQNKVIRTLALAVDGEITGNVEYYLPGTPCENIMEKSICSYVSGVAEKFPKDTMLKQMGMEGYVGVPLFDSQGGALGIMAALFRKPIANAEFTEAILQIFSSRTGSELERLRSDKALVASEARYKAILEAEPDLMFQLSEDGVHLDFYASSLDKLYIDPKEFLGKRVNEILPPEVGEKYRHYIQKTLKTSQMQVFEYQLAFPEGPRYYDCRMVLSGENKTLAIVRDITERKQAEDNLRQTQRTNQIILQAIPDLLIRVSRNGIYKEIHCVKGFEPIWGKENVIGKHLTDVLPADIADQILTAIEKAFASQKMRSLEYTLHIHDQKRWRIQNHPLLQGRGHHHAPRHHQKKKERTSPPPKRSQTPGRRTHRGPGTLGLERPHT